MNVKNRQQLLTIAAALVIAFWLGDKVLFTPLVASWKSRSVEMARLEKSIRQGSLMLDRERVIHENWNGMITNTLPAVQSEAEGRVLKAFDTWSDQSRISVTSIKPQWKISGEDYMTMDCRVDAFGNLDSITRFLHSIESDPMALKIDMVELSARDKDGATVTLGLQVSGLVLNSNQP
jgi:hypothetical protein